MRRPRSAAATALVLALLALCTRNAVAADCDRDLQPALAPCRTAPSSPQCCAAQSAFNAGLCFCPGYQTYYTAPQLVMLQTGFSSYCSGTAITGAACPLPPPPSPPAPPSPPPTPTSAPAAPVWAYAIYLSSTNVQLTASFSATDAAALTSLTVRRSRDASFTADSSTTTLGPLPALAASSPGAAANSFAVQDTTAGALSASAPNYYSVRATTIGGVGPWSAPFAVINGTGALFASPGGAAAGSCGALSAPCGAIADALAAAAPAQPILLLPGNYSGAGNQALSMAGNSLSVSSVLGSAFTIQDCKDAARGWLFVTGESIAAGASLSGLTIVGARGSAGAGALFYSASAALTDVVFAYGTLNTDAAVGSATRSAGGAVLLYNSSSTFTNVVFTGNVGSRNGGGAVFAEEGSNATFTNCVAYNNTNDASGKGGAFKLVTRSSPTFINVTIQKNEAYFGGGFYSESGAPTLINVSMLENYGSYGGGGLAMGPGSLLRCIGCVIARNIAANLGGGVLSGSGLLNPTFINSFILNNTAESGGGMYLAAVTHTTVQGSVISGNTASASGGGWWVEKGSSLTMAASTTSGNTADRSGGGGWCGEATVTLTRATLASNSAEELGGGMYVAADCVLTADTSDFNANNAASGGGITVAAGGQAALTGSFVRNNNAATGGGIYLPETDTVAHAGAAPASLTLTSTVMDSNVATLDGGALALLAGTADLTTGAVSSNTAGADGGGISVKGSSSVSLTGVALLGNAAAVSGGGVVLAGEGGARLTISLGVLAGNSAGIVGGAAALHAPLFGMHGALVADNAADRGGGVHVATDFAPAAAACSAYAAAGIDCVSPLQSLNFTGNTARAGSSIFWSRAASPVVQLDCFDCSTEWPPRPSEFSTEPLSVRFGAVALPAAVVTNREIDEWSAVLVDFYGAVATASDNYTCTVSAGDNGVMTSLQDILLLVHASTGVTNGVASFDSLTIQGRVGLTYELDVQCTAADPTAPQLPLLISNVTISPCPPGTEASKDERFCAACKGGDFNLVPGGTCMRCPMGATCPAGDRLEALPDWWRSANTSTLLFSCPMRTACQPGPDVGNQACLPGYLGPVCAVCDMGYYPWGHECKKCTTDFNWLMPLAGTAAAIVFFMALFLLPIRPEDPEPAVRVKIAMTLLQVLGLIKDYAVQWRPSFLLTSMAYFDVLNIGVEMTAPNCGSRSMDFYSAYIVTMLLPAGAVILCASMWLIYRAMIEGPLGRARPEPLVLCGRMLLPASSARSEAQKADMLQAFKTRCLKNCFWLLMLLYPGVCKKVMQLYGTRSLDMGSFLRADYGIRTRDDHFHHVDTYQRYAAGGAFMCILYPLGIPLLFAALMRHERRTKNLKGEQFLDSYIGFVSAGYSVKAIYWELLEMFRKLAMAAIGVFAVDGAFNAATTPDVSGALSPVVQPFLGQFVTVLYLALLLWHRPYERPLHNVIQAASLLMTWLCLLVGESLFNMASSTGAISHSRQNVIGVWLGTMLLICIICIVLWAVEGTARDMHSTLKKKLPGLLSRTGSVMPMLSSRATSAADTVMEVVPDDAAHAEALSQVDTGAVRAPRVADGEQYSPGPPPRAPRISDGELFMPSPPPGSPLQSHRLV